MGNRAKFRQVLAAEQPFPPPKGGEGGRTPGPSVGTPTSRSIPKNHKFDPKALKPLARTLWAMSVSMGHALQAYRTLNRVKSSTVSPDGLLGGRGYVMKVTELRQKLYDAVEALSMISDTIHDEINAPHWQPKLAELDEHELQAIDRLMGESEEMLDDPEKEVEEDADEVEKKGKPSPNWPPKKTKTKGKSSEIPDGGDSETVPRKRSKQASSGLSLSERVAMRAAGEVWAEDVSSNSTLPTQTVPGGPRVQHLDRADSDQTGPFGALNEEESLEFADAWVRDEGVPSTWDSDDNLPMASSAVPTDDTETQGFDFGIGDGNGDQAVGQGALLDSLGPAAGLPDDPGGKIKDNTSDTNLTLDMQLQDRIRAAEWKTTKSDLPNDHEPPVARSDYFDGPKGGNDADTVRGQTELPGDGTKVLDDTGTGTLDKGYRYERGDQPYTKWDSTTHNQRPDWLNMRDPIQGPYVKQ